MISPSNLYAEKIFAEHPISLWALDDKADYIDLLTTAKRDFSTWSVIGGTSEVLTETQTDQPFPESSISLLLGDTTLEESGQIVFKSADVLSFDTLNETLKTFSIGCFVKSLSAYLSSVEIGYEYDNPVIGENPIQILKLFSLSIKDRWFFVSETFEIPESSENLRVIIKINYISGGSSSDSYKFLINGVSLGQWSEEFNATSLGVEKTLLPSSIALPETYGIEANAYGLYTNKGYYLLDSNSLLAKNTGIPLVYGAENLTRLSPNNNLPSLIVPGLGFLGEDGKYKDYTLEMWIRVNSDSATPKRIVGPISSTDGLYVSGPFLMLKINNYIGSYYVGEWARPMLIHIRVGKDYASLMVNGEEVVSLNYITEELSFPSKIGDNLKDQDWIGFYSYEDVSPVEVDCVALYTYQVPVVLAKKRFVYGQGVEFPEGINQAYSGSSVYIDYPFADYTNNYSYPNIGKWNQATIDNLDVNNNILSTPEYALPEVFLESGTLDDFYSDLKESNTISEEVLPHLSFSSVSNGHLVFDNLNFLKERVKSFYASIRLVSAAEQQQTIFRIQSENSEDYFEIVQNGLKVDYNLKYGSAEKITIASTVNMEVDQLFSVGIDIDRLSFNFGGDLSSFFANVSGVKVYVGGLSNFTETFQGNIYKVGFCTAKNHEKISYLFSDRGIPAEYEDVFELYMSTADVDYNSTDNYFQTSSYIWDYSVDSGNVYSFIFDGLHEHTASYTLSTHESLGEYYLDIDVNGYWEDQIPLTYLSQYVEDEKGSRYYDLDFVQFNINYPSPSRSSDDLFYDTSSSLVRSFVTFQYTTLGANLSLDSFPYYIKPKAGSIIEVGSDIVDYEQNNDGTPDYSRPVYDTILNTKYEVINNSIIYKPKDINSADLSLVTHLDFNVTGILKNKVSIKSLEYASQAFNSTSPNPIGTRFGNQIYPYTKSGFYYDYKNQNPFVIYKGSSPYLYLTRYSGIEVKGDADEAISRGISIPINKEFASNYKVMAMQAAIRYDHDTFSTTPVEIFEIESKNAHLKFYMVSVHPDNERAKIYAINVRTGVLEQGIAFFWNGKIVKEPHINTKEWGFLGISFPNTLNFENMVGSIRLTGPLTFNTISHYQSTNLQEVQQVEIRPWFNVKNIGPLTLEWDYWKTSAYVWNDVLVLSSTSYYGVDPSTIYKSYTGTNKIIIDSNKTFKLKNYEYKVYSGISVQQNTVDAV